MSRCECDEVPHRGFCPARINDALRELRDADAKESPATIARRVRVETIAHDWPGPADLEGPR